MHNIPEETDLVTVTKTVTIKYNNMIVTVPCSPKLYGISEGNIKEFYLKLQIDKGKFKEFSNVEGERLRIHAIIFVPETMTSLGWTNAFKTQELWFEGVANSNMNIVDPVLDFVPVSWVRSFERIDDEYAELISEDWKLSGKIDLLKDEIRKMVTNGLVSWPTTNNNLVNFGTFSKSLVTYNGEKMPEIEQYYYCFRGYEISMIPLEPLDDFFGTFASFNWHVAAKGILEYVNPTDVKVTIQKIGVYIKDNFDFDSMEDGEYTDEKLGAWDFLEKDVDRINMYTKAGEFKISNMDYRNYRTELGKGYNYHYYSEVKELNVTPFEFTFII